MPLAIRAFFSPYFARWAQYGLFFRPISPVGLNTGFFSPYFARWAQYGLFFALLPLAIRAFFLPYFARWAQYGLFFALFRPLAIRAFFRPISPVGLNTGFWRLLPVGQYAAFPGLRYAYPGLCSGALSGRSFPSPNRQRPPRRASILPCMPSTPATTGVYVRSCILILQNDYWYFLNVFFIRSMTSMIQLNCYQTFISDFFFCIMRVWPYLFHGSRPVAFYE